MTNDVVLTVLVIYFVPFVAVLTIMNVIYRNKYNELMQHLEAHHPQIHEEIRIKPVRGRFYGKNAYRKSLDYAYRHDPLDDPVAEELLADYANHHRKTAVVAVVFLLGWSLLLCWVLWRD